MDFGTNKTVGGAATLWPKEHIIIKLLKKESTSEILPIYHKRQMSLLGMAATWDTPL